MEKDMDKKERRAGKLSDIKFKEPKVKKSVGYGKKSIWKKIAEWFLDYYRVAIPAFICVALVAVVIGIMVSQDRIDDVTAYKEQPEEVPEEEVPVEDFEVEETGLEENAYEQVNNLIAAYYDAMANGDVDGYALMRDETDDTEKIRMEIKSNYIDNYQNIICYTKPGPFENSHVVYVYYEVKFVDVETLAPGLNTLLVDTKEDGSLYIGAALAETDEVYEYIQKVSLQEDVSDLFNRVKVTYAEVVDTDEALKVFLDNLSVNMKDDVSEALAALEAARLEQELAEAEQNKPVEEEPEVVEPEKPATEMVKTTEKVNIRASSTTASDKLGVASKGQVFTRLEALDNGWSRLEYNGAEAYIMSEYLTVVENVIGSVTVLENVNVRASSSASATKLGAAMKGEVFELIEEVGNGWSKINYKGQTAYIKSEYLKRN